MHPTTPVSYKFVKHFFTIVNSVLVHVSKSSYSLSWYIRRRVRRLSLLLSLPVDSSLLECDCLFIIMFRQTAESVLRKKFLKKIIFNATVKHWNRSGFIAATLYSWLKSGFRIRIRIGSVFNRASGSGSVFGIRIRIQAGKNDPQK